MAKEHWLRPTNMTLDAGGLAWLDRYGAESGRSEQLREDLEVLRLLVRDGERSLAGRFTESEISLICDAANGHLWQPHEMAGDNAYLVAVVEDALVLDSAKWEVRADEVLATLRTLSPAEGMALIHLVRTFWATGKWSPRRVPDVFKCRVTLPRQTVTTLDKL